MKLNNYYIQGEKLVEEADRIVRNLPAAVKDAVYRQIRMERVAGDVRSWLSNDERVANMTEPEKEELINSVAIRYVFGEYDQELSYWTNLENLIVEELLAKEEPEI